jgi:hypothetical protein
VEFTLVAPLFLVLLFGVVEYSLINASVGTYNFAAKDAARYGAIIGKGAAPGPTAIDTYVVNSIIIPRVTGVVIAQMTKVEIYDASESGTCIVDTSTTPAACKEDIFQQSGGAWASTSNSWPSASRNDALANADYFGVRISYTYTYLTAFFAVTSPTINLTATSVQRIEPQEYGKRQSPTAPVWAWNEPPGWASAPRMALAPLGAFVVWERRNLACWMGERA